jgi:hypothetical protein
MSVVTPTYPLGIRERSAFSPEQITMLTALESYDLWFVTERIERKQLLPAEVTVAALTEFRKYMALIGLGYRRLAMTSKEVDEIWHQFILFTREYQEFCHTVFGEFIHHAPVTSRDPLAPGGVERFVDAYRDVFGELHPLWQGAITCEDEDCKGGCGGDGDCSDEG